MLAPAFITVFLDQKAMVECAVDRPIRAYLGEALRGKVLQQIVSLISCAPAAIQLELVSRILTDYAPSPISGTTTRAIQALPTHERVTPIRAILNTGDRRAIDVVFTLIPNLFQKDVVALLEDILITGAAREKREVTRLIHLVNDEAE